VTLSNWNKCRLRSGVRKVIVMGAGARDWAIREFLITKILVRSFTGAESLGIVRGYLPL
jgi:hypothetical protein